MIRVFWVTKKNIFYWKITYSSTRAKVNTEKSLRKKASMYPDRILDSSTPWKNLLWFLVNSLSRWAGIMGLKADVIRSYGRFLKQLKKNPSACGVLVPWVGIEPVPPALAAWSPNHWTTREVPSGWFYGKIRPLNNSLYRQHIEVRNNRRKLKLRERIRDLVFTTPALCLNFFRNVIFVHIYDFCFPYGKSYSKPLNNVCSGVLIWGWSKVPPPTLSMSCYLHQLHISLLTLLFVGSLCIRWQATCLSSVLSYFSWQRPGGIGTTINCLTRKRKTLTEHKRLVQSHTATPVQTELDSAWLQSHPHPNHWPTLPCQEDMILTAWKTSSSKLYSLFFWNHVFHSAKWGLSCFT